MEFALTREQFFDELRDGEWHDLKDIAAKLEIQIGKLIEYVQFLQSQCMVKYEELTQRVKIEPEWKIILPHEIQNHAKQNH